MEEKTNNVPRKMFTLPEFRGNSPEEILSNLYDDLKIENADPDTVVINEKDSLKLSKKMRRNTEIGEDDDRIHKLLLTRGPLTDAHNGIDVPKGKVKIMR